MKIYYRTGKYTKRRGTILTKLTFTYEVLDDLTGEVLYIKHNDIIPITRKFYLEL